MNPRWAGLTAPFRWLIDALDVGRHQPAVIITAIIITSVVGMLPSIPPQLMTLAGAPPGAVLGGVFQVIGVIVGVAISPVLVAGVYRLIDGAEQGRPVAVAQLGDGFGDGSWGAIALVTVFGYVLMFVVLVVMMLTMVAVAGLDTLQSLQQWFEQIMALQAKAQESGTPIKPDALPAVPDGAGAVLGVMFAFLPLWTLVALGMAWALVSVALRRTAPLAAVLAGLQAAFLNALPLLVFVMALLLPAALAGMLFGLVMAAVVALASLLGPLVGGVIMLALVLAITVVFAAISYGFLLNGWRAACDDGAAPTSVPPADVTGFEA